MVNEAPIAPRVSSGPAQSVVGRDVGISVEMFIVGASEVQYKTRTRISSLGRSKDYDVVLFPNLSQASSCFLIHGMCVIRLQVVPASCLHVAVQENTCRRRAGQCLQRGQPAGQGFGGGKAHVASNRKHFNDNFVFWLPCNGRAARHRTSPPLWNSSSFIDRICGRSNIAGTFAAASERD